MCREVFDDDALLVIDGGNTAVWTNLYHENRVPGCTLSTFKFGMLGAGVGQALGAKAAQPDRFVACLTGDGAFGFHPQEVETRGLPQALLDGLPEEHRLRLPMRPGNRSLNLSNAAAVVIYEAWRQLGFAQGA